VDPSVFADILTSTWRFPDTAGTILYDGITSGPKPLVLLRRLCIYRGITYILVI